MHLPGLVTASASIAVETAYDVSFNFAIRNGSWLLTVQVDAVGLSIFPGFQDLSCWAKEPSKPIGSYVSCVLCEAKGIHPELFHLGFQHVPFYRYIEILKKIMYSSQSLLISSNELVKVWLIRYCMWPGVGRRKRI